MVPPFWQTDTWCHQTAFWGHIVNPFLSNNQNKGNLSGISPMPVRFQIRPTTEFGISRTVLGIPVLRRIYSARTTTTTAVRVFMHMCAHWEPCIALAPGLGKLIKDLHAKSTEGQVPNWQLQMMSCITMLMHSCTICSKYLD